MVKIVAPLSSDEESGDEVATRMFAGLEDEREEERGIRFGLPTMERVSDEDDSDAVQVSHKSKQKQGAKRQKKKKKRKNKKNKNSKQTQDDDVDDWASPIEAPRSVARRGVRFDDDDDSALIAHQQHDSKADNDDAEQLNSSEFGLRRHAMPLAQQLGLNAAKLHMMNASLFADDAGDDAAFYGDEDEDDGAYGRMDEAEDDEEEEEQPEGDDDFDEDMPEALVGRDALGDDMHEDAAAQRDVSILNASRLVSRNRLVNVQQPPLRGVLELFAHTDRAAGYGATVAAQKQYEDAVASMPTQLPEQVLDSTTADDRSISMRRSFGVGWGPHGTLVHVLHGSSRVVIKRVRGYTLVDSVAQQQQQQQQSSDAEDRVRADDLYEEQLAQMMEAHRKFYANLDAQMPFTHQQQPQQQQRPPQFGQLPPFTGFAASASAATAMDEGSDDDDDDDDKDGGDQEPSRMVDGRSFYFSNRETVRNAELGMRGASPEALSTLCSDYARAVQEFVNAHSNHNDNNNNNNHNSLGAVSRAVLGHARFQSSVWTLVNSLWSPHLGAPLINNTNTVGASSSSSSSRGEHEYDELFARRQALSKWIRRAVREEVLRDMQRVGQRIDKDGVNTQVRAAFVALSGYQVKRACKAAVAAKDFRLATLLAQIGQNARTRERLMEQLRLWERTGVWDAVDDDHRRIYELLSVRFDTITDKGSEELNNAYANMSWLRNLGMLLWYATDSSTPIPSVLERYEAVVREVERKDADDILRAPRPPYFDAEARSSWPTVARKFRDARRTTDTRFGLLKLYVDRHHPLYNVLLPETSTPSHLDHQLPWLLHDMLQHTKACPTFGRFAELFVNFIAQLDAMGLWEWAIYVAMFSQRYTHEHAQRFEYERLVREILARNVPESRQALRMRLIAERVGAENAAADSIGQDAASSAAASTLAAATGAAAFLSTPSSLGVRSRVFGGDDDDDLKHNTNDENATAKHIIITTNNNNKNNNNHNNNNNNNNNNKRSTDGHRKMLDVMARDPLVSRMQLEAELDRRCQQEQERFERVVRFLIDDVRVPVQWIHEARAVRARFDGVPEIELVHAMEAGLWEDAHDVFTRHIVAQWVVQERLDDMAHVLQRMRHHRDQIPEWDTIGELLFEYMQIPADFAKAQDALEAARSSQISLALGPLTRLRDRIRAALAGFDKLRTTEPQRSLCPPSAGSEDSSVARQRRLVSQVALSEITTRLTGMLASVQQQVREVSGDPAYKPVSLSVKMGENYRLQYLNDMTLQHLHASEQQPYE